MNLRVLVIDRANWSRQDGEDEQLLVQYCACSMYPPTPRWRFKAGAKQPKVQPPSPLCVTAGRVTCKTHNPVHKSDE
jgi:hypothetical protein